MSNEYKEKFERMLRIIETQQDLCNAISKDRDRLREENTRLKNERFMFQLLFAVFGESPAQCVDCCKKPKKENEL